MSDENTRLLPPKPGGWDYAQKITKGLVSSIPFAGGVSGEFFDMVVKPPLTRRNQRWMEEVHRAIAELRASIPSFDPSTLADNEVFISAVLRATAAAVKTHEEQKLGALRNAVQTVAAGNDFDAESELFIGLVDRFAALHIKILHFIVVKSGNVMEYPFLRDINLAEAAAADLAQSGLITPAVKLKQQHVGRLAGTNYASESPVNLNYSYFDSLQTLADPEPSRYVAAATTTEVGERFYRFINGGAAATRRA